MYKRIIIMTRDGRKFAGDIYKVDKTSPVIFGYHPRSTEQEFDELEKLRLTYTITIDEMERWWSEEVKDEANFVKGILPKKSGNYRVRYQGVEGRDDFTVNGNHWWNTGAYDKPEEVEWDPDSFREL